jgi:hypothetical protein
MRIDSLQYLKLLLADLNRKRNDNRISPFLLRPTPANLKQECAHVCQERFAKKDEQTLRAFFGPADSEKKFLKLIEDFPIDKFRPLVKYLKGETETTDDKNLEILAWLIDFKHRPLEFAKEVELTKEELSILEKSASDRGLEKAGEAGERNILREGILNENAETHLLPEIAVGDDRRSLPPAIGSPERNRRSSRVTAGVLILLIFIICAIALWRQDETGCMYWTGDHYEAIPCDTGDNNIFKLPMDSEKLRNFRRILQDDTITEASIGKIYYIQIGGRIEYYTMKGRHPVDMTRNLRVLSKYMYNKHLRKI